MKTLIVYSSKTGFTEKYAKWIAEEIPCTCLPLQEAENLDIKEYDTILFGGGFYAGKINGINWLQKRIPDLTGKKAALFCTGASPEDSPEIPQAIDQNLSKEQQKIITPFYLQGGINYEKMTWKDKALMAVFRKILKTKKDKTPQEQAMETGIAASFDATNRQKLTPLFNWLNQ